MHASSLIFASSALLGFLSLATSSALPQDKSCPLVICVDKINECGVKYGGCYDTCTEEPPADPGCPAETPEPRACPQILCVDKINACGIRYGACYDTCTESPPEDPGCPTTTTSLVTRSTPTDDCFWDVCIDAVNECGQGYGGCFYVPCGVFPTPTPPPCPKN